LPRKGQLTVTYLTDAHRACAQRISAHARCGFDEVTIDAVGNVVAARYADKPTHGHC
jgi:N-carbamoyl-L-amino-acid hydrolase